MFKKFFIFLFTVFLTVNCYSDKGIITVQERCQIAYKNLELLNNPNREIFIREEGKLRKLYYSEILAQRAENEEIIRKFCTQRAEENITNSAKYETRSLGEPSPNIALKQALIAGDIDAVLTALEVVSIDYAIEKTIRALIAKEDFDGALAALEEGEKNSKNKNKTNSAITNSGSSSAYSGSSGAMPTNGDNDKNGIKEKNDYTNKPKQKANSAETGDKIRTPDSHPNDFVKLRGNQGYQNKHTGEIWQRSDTKHMGKQGEWKVGIGKNPPQKGSKITVEAQTGKVLKK